MLLDTAVIDEVRDTLGDDTYRRFAERMLAEVVETTANLHVLLAKGDHETLARAAHRTCGSAAGTGAKGLHALLKEIENTARAPSGAAALPALIALLPTRAEETRKALDAHIPS
jgi:HPt (histidine-containing phosphotransfer) domain-containing protein